MSERLQAMHEHYRDGRSLEQVATLFGVTRQSAYSMFKRHGLPTRPKQLQPYIEYGGLHYTQDKDSYLRCTTGDRHFLHQRIWTEHFGPIPEGFDLHHKDTNKENNSLDNLEVLPKSEHGRIHANKLPVQLKPCLYCAGIIERHNPENPAAYNKRRFCSLQCSGRWKRGKRKGTCVDG